MIKLVSIIIPCYNSEKYIRETVLSVINQTYENIEILCVDNGSTDGTLKILNTLKSDFPQIQLLIQPKKGAPAARNLGLAQSKGEVIQFLDSDDLLIPNKIEKQ
ncbi:MAG: glycosyltransferase family 2 protein, partial [Crocinitomicaceae bacterium]|nr:glycosyltransferase family 2 protein [Crocinitomicaceae bacterium]